jgi:hypothetical protein
MAFLFPTGVKVGSLPKNSASLLFLFYHEGKDRNFTLGNAKK